MAPEIVRRVEYEGKPVDIWSLGILLYALLCGCFPFRAKAYPDLYRRIARGTFAIPDELSAPVKDLLRQLLTVDPEQRITSHAALRHSWLQVQYINAPNMDKLRQEMTTLISEKPAEDLDEQAIAELMAFGMSRDEIIRLVLTKTHSSLATLYYLLLDVVVNRRKANGTNTGKKGLSSAPVVNANAGNASNPMSLNAAMSAKYARKTVAGAPGAGGGGAAVPVVVGGSNFSNPILAQNNMSGKPMPVTAGAINVTQAVNDAAASLLQQQQIYGEQTNNNPFDYRTTANNNNLGGGGGPARPKSASQNRVSNINTLMSSNNTPSNTNPMVYNGSMNSSSNNSNPLNNINNNNNPAMNGYGILNQGAQQQQRPLSAYAGRR
jgi:serine/threonine protein kinase